MQGPISDKQIEVAARSDASSHANAAPGLSDEELVGIFRNEGAWPELALRCVRKIRERTRASAHSCSTEASNLSDEDLARIQEEYREEYGQLCDMDDMREYGRRCAALALTRASAATVAEPGSKLKITKGYRDGNFQHFDVNGHGGFISVVARMEDDDEDLPMSKEVEDFLLGKAAQQPAGPNALRPDFSAIEDMRIGEMTPAQRDDSKELWLRNNLGFMTNYYHEHLQFLLRRLDEARALAKSARPSGDELQAGPKPKGGDCDFDGAHSFDCPAAAQQTEPEAAQLIDRIQAIYAPTTKDVAIGKVGTGVVKGGAFLEFANGSTQSQVAMFTGAEHFAEGERDANAAFYAGIHGLIPEILQALAARSGQCEEPRHPVSGETLEELWLETGRLRREIADMKADQRADDNAQAVRDMLDDARAELDMVRKALGVDDEPHQSLAERTLHAAVKAGHTAPGKDTERLDAIEAGIELSRRLNPDCWTARPLFKSWPKGVEFQTAREAIDFAIELNKN